MMLTIEQYWMGRDLKYRRDLTPEIIQSAQITVQRANELLAAFGEARAVSSGWRPPAVNAGVPGAAANSNHQRGTAVDLADPQGTLDRWCLEHLEVLCDIGLWLEHPGWTDTWCHVQIVPPRSGARVFIPSAKPPAVSIYGRVAIFDGQTWSATA